jgi:hypothetical protein
MGFAPLQGELVYRVVPEASHLAMVFRRLRRYEQEF